MGALKRTPAYRTRLPPDRETVKMVSSITSDPDSLTTSLNFPSSKIQKKIAAPAFDRATYLRTPYVPPTYPRPAPWVLMLQGPVMSAPGDRGPVMSPGGDG